MGPACPAQVWLAQIDRAGFAPGDDMDIKRIFARARGFGRKEDGALYIFGLFIFLFILMSAGLSLDVMRYEAYRTRLQATLDRAVLAAASLDQPLDPADVVMDYFEKAGLSGYIDRDDIEVDMDATYRYVSAQARMNMRTSLLQFSGIETLSAPSSGAAEESASQTEISMVLDVSGSMGWTSASGNTKISELRTAAKQFVNIVLCNPNDPTQTTNCTVEEGKISVTLVPYAEQVLLGESLLQRFNTTEEHAYSSCVTFAASDFNTTAIDFSQQFKRTGHFDGRFYSGYPQYRACLTNSWREVEPYLGDVQVLHNEINSLQAYGATSIDIGMKWGATFLDPSIKSTISDMVSDGEIDADYDGRPFGDEARGVSKIIVLMTDGVNTDQYYLHDWARSGPSPVWKLENGQYSVYRADVNMYYWPHDDTWWSQPGGDAGLTATRMSYPRLWNERTWRWFTNNTGLPRPGDVYWNAEKNQRLHNICTAAKDNKIRVFTVGFEVDDTSAAVMRDCASKDGDFFRVDGMNIVDAFSSIAREIMKLRLVN